jgi:hypothetical protein
MKRIALALICSAAFVSFVFADGDQGGTTLEVEGYYEFPNQEALGTSSYLVPITYGVSAGAPGERDIGYSWGSVDIKAILDRKLVFPAFAGDGPLTKDNNLALDFSGELSPVSLNANFKATLTPIAFFQLAAGGGVGTGWTVGIGGLGSFTGMGINDRGTIEDQNFGGLIYRAWVQGTLQFDLAAVLPGEWHHVVLVASPMVEYAAYTGAGANTPWIWEDDNAMDFNGWQLYGNYFVGYQMPLALDTVGFLFETQGWLGSVRDSSPGSSGGWGSDFVQYTFGPAFDFKISGNSNITILPQFQNGIKWSDGTTRALYFENRVYAGTYLYFYRIAFDYSLKL